MNDAFVERELQCQRVVEHDEVEVHGRRSAATTKFEEVTVERMHLGANGGGRVLPQRPVDEAPDARTPNRRLPGLSLLGAQFGDTGLP